MENKIIKTVQKHKNLVLILILLLNIFFVIPCMNQPFHGDQLCFVEAAKGFLETGRPMLDMNILEQNMQGLWHPPTYLHLIGLFISLFGESMYSIRAVATMFNLFTIIMVYLIAKEILKKNQNKEFWALFAALLYAINPLTVQSSILLDIDGGLLNFAIYLFLYFFIKNKSMYYLIPSLFLVFFSKETGPVIMFATLMLFYISTFNWKKIPQTILLFFISGGLFAIIFWLYTYLLDLDFLQPFKLNAGLGVSSFGWITSLNVGLIKLLKAAWSFKLFLYFVIPFFLILFAYFLFVFYRKVLETKQWSTSVKQIHLLNLFSVITICLFCYLGTSSWGFPKYYITALPGMCIFVAYMFSKMNFSVRKYSLFAVMSFLLLLYFLIFIPHPLLPEFDASAQNADILKAITLISHTFFLYAIIPFFACFFIFLIIDFQNTEIFRIKKIFVLVLIFLYFFLAFYLNILHTTVDYSTYNKYGDIGVLETVDYLQESTKLRVASYPHIIYYLGMRENYDVTTLWQPEVFKKEIINNDEAEYIAIWERGIAKIGEENLAYFDLERKIGTYYIFKKKISG